MRVSIYLASVIAIASVNVISAPMERVLNVSVNMVVNQQSPQINIVANKTDFLVVYSSSLKRFQSLAIPFSIRQIDGSSHNYLLTIPQVTGQCTPQGAATQIISLSATLDNQIITPTSSFAGTAAPEQAHILNISFPDINQTETSQLCEGTASVIAAVLV